MNHLRPTLQNNIVFSKGMTKISVDDKGRIPVGEPGLPVRSNVRPMSAKLVAAQLAKEKDALDHDYHRATVRASMMLISQGGEGDWRKGQVVCTLKEGITQYSTAFRHGIEMRMQLQGLIKKQDTFLTETGQIHEFPEGTCKPYTLLVRSDGGSDRNPKNVSVQMALIYLWLSLDFDVLVALITAADISAVNEVEGVMPIANYALQHQSFAREAMTIPHEHNVKNCNSALQVRNALDHFHDPKEALLAWRRSIAPVLATIEARLTQMVYTNKQIVAGHPAFEEDFDDAYALLRQRIDSNINSDKTTKAKIKDCPDLLLFMDTHTTRKKAGMGRENESKYTWEIKKCGEVTCKFCSKVRMPEPMWKEITSRPRLIPMPEIKSREGKDDDVLVKYHQYEDLKYRETKSLDMPSYGSDGLNLEERRKKDRIVGKTYPLTWTEKDVNKTHTLWHCNNV